VSAVPKPAFFDSAIPATLCPAQSKGNHRIHPRSGSPSANITRDQSNQNQDHSRWRKRERISWTNPIQEVRSCFFRIAGAGLLPDCLDPVHVEFVILQRPVFMVESSTEPCVVVIPGGSFGSNRVGVSPIDSHKKLAVWIVFREVEFALCRQTRTARSRISSLLGIC
jgi:hypothetical protein